MQLPTRENKESLTTQVNAELLERVRIVVKDRKIKLRQAVEFGLRAFLNEADSQLSLFNSVAPALAPTKAKTILRRKAE